MVIKKNFNQFFFVYLSIAFVIIFVFIIFFWGTENYLFKVKCDKISKFTFFIQHFGGNPQNTLFVGSNKMFGLNFQDVFGHVYGGEIKPFVAVAENENVLMWYIAGVVCSILIMSGTIISMCNFKMIQFYIKI